METTEYQPHDAGCLAIVNHGDSDYCDCDTTRRYCEICGELEGSPYAKHCCSDPDNLAEV